MSEDKAREHTDTASEPAADATVHSDESRAPGPAAGKHKTAKRRKKKRARRGAVIALTVALVVVFILLALLLGYALGHRTRTESRSIDLGSVQEAEGDAGLSFDNQEALNALAGADIPMDEEAASALLGEDDFFADATEAAPRENVVVAEFGDGGTLMSDEVLDAYSEELSNYILDGYSEDEVAGTVLNEVLHRLVSERVLEEHAKALGMFELSEEDRAQIDARAQELYAQRISDCIAFGLIGTDGLSEEEAQDAAKAWLLGNEGVDLDALRAQVEADWWKEKLYAAVTADVTVSDDDVRSAYAERLAQQKQSFTDSPEEYEYSQMNGELLLYRLPGYRAVKILLLGFDDPDAEMAAFSLTGDFSALDDSDAASAAERQARLDELYAGPEARAEQALEELRGGADMDDMIGRLGSDPGMMDEQLRRTGYYVSADSQLWPETFVQAAMGLKEVGDYSEPVRLDEGVCILQYIGEAPSGEAPLDEVYDELRAQVLKDAQDAAYLGQTQAWVDEANPSYYPERMQ